MYQSTVPYLAEQQGFEPWQHFHVLRDFESRLFDHLSTAPLTRVLYQQRSKKSRFLFGHFKNAGHFFTDSTVIFPTVGLQTFGAIFNAIFCVGKAAAAILTQAIQRAIAEQTAESFRVCTGMTGKIFTFLVLKKIIMRHGHSSRFLFLRMRPA